MSLLGNICANTLPLLADKPAQKELLWTKDIGGGQSMHAMIVLVHGTIIPMPIGPRRLCTFIHDFFIKRDNASVCHAYMDQLRYSGLYKYQPAGPRGLYALDQYSPEEQAKIFTPQTIPITQAMDHVWRTMFSSRIRTHWYTFGWSGMLDENERLDAAQNLYQSLLVERKRRAAQLGINEDDLKIILMGHSHGGNVILNLAKEEEKHHKDLKIASAVFLGTPIQPQTADCAKHSMFEKVVSFYSKNDSVQVMDFVSSKNWESKRCFPFRDQRLLECEVNLGKDLPYHAEWWFSSNPMPFIQHRYFGVRPWPFLVLAPVAIHFAFSNSSVHGHARMSVDSNDKGHNVSFIQDDVSVHSFEVERFSDSKRDIYAFVPKI